MNHPMLGLLVYDREERGWVGAVALPSLSGLGTAVADEYRSEGYESYQPHLDLFAAGRTRLLIHGNRTAGPSAEQAEAVRRVLADEAAVAALVVAQLQDAFPGDAPPRVWCRAVEVASKRMGGGYPGGVGFLGFVFTGGTYEECPVCVVYHPERGAWWAAASLDEALADA